MTPKLAAFITVELYCCNRESTPSARQN